ncbi:MAG: DUF5808 domain-containing protein [Ignavibacteria bacterium]|nr:DUF5808 domain-containing protein [Ignavibacteria bacterium]
MMKEKPTHEQYQKWHDDPANWQWGVIYYNKEDKRLFPPKRIQALGWTINFANPVSIIAMIVLIVISLIIFDFMINKK